MLLEENDSNENEDCDIQILRCLTSSLKNNLVFEMKLCKIFKRLKLVLVSKLQVINTDDLNN